MSRMRMLVAVFLVAAALSAMAASSAQAGWLVLGSLLVGSTAISPTVVIDKRTVAIFSSIEVECTGLALKGGTISEPDKFLIGSLEFSGCAVLKPTSCTLEGGKVNTLPVEGLATLDGLLATKAKVEPENGSELFATFKFSGSSCTLSGKQAIVGTSEILVPTGRDERLSQLFNSLQETAGELKVGSAEMQVTGSSLLRLENDMTWSFD